MMRSLYSGVAGLKVHQTGMDVVGNNIANVNTTGFKSFRATYQDTIYQTSSGAAAPQDNKGGVNPVQVGLGVGSASIDKMFKDGSIQTTSSNTDLCLSGDALFMVNDGDNKFYTRNGAFKFDGQGNYVNSAGLYVQGWMAENGKVTTGGGTSNIKIDAADSMKPAATSVATYSKNLNAGLEGTGITNVLVKYTDGTTETVQNYSPARSESATIKLNLSDGSTVIPDPGVYKAGDAITDGVWSGTIKSLSANAEGPVEVTVSNTDAAGNSRYKEVTFTNNPIEVKNGTYSIGGLYSETLIIDEVTTDMDNFVKLKFKSGGNIDSIKVPLPENGEYKPNEQFTVSLYVKDATAGDGATMTCETANGVQVSKADTGVKLSDGTVTYKAPADTTIESITRVSNGGYVFNGKEVASVNVNLADGTMSEALIGQKYNAGKLYYPSSATTLTVYDELGNNHTVPVIFTKIANNTWELSLAGGGNTMSISEPDGSTTTVTLVTSQLKFDSKGQYIDGAATVSMEYGNGASSGEVSLGLSGITQYAGSNTVNAYTDGYGEGILTEVNIDSSGTITGTYSNGMKQVKAQVAVARFNNPGGLTAKGSTLFQESNNSGTTKPQTASELGVTITASALEMSNVDLANEFSTMIVTQRGYQSNSKIITVSDEMLETLINMKR